MIGFVAVLVNIVNDTIKIIMLTKAFDYAPADPTIFAKLFIVRCFCSLNVGLIDLAFFIVIVVAVWLFEVRTFIVGLQKFENAVIILAVVCDFFSARARWSGAPPPSRAPRSSRCPRAAFGS